MYFRSIAILLFSVALVFSGVREEMEALTTWDQLQTYYNQHKAGTYKCRFIFKYAPDFKKRISSLIYPDWLVTAAQQAPEADMYCSREANILIGEMGYSASAPALYAEYQRSWDTHGIPGFVVRTAIISSLRKFGTSQARSYLYDMFVSYPRGAVEEGEFEQLLMQSDFFMQSASRGNSGEVEIKCDTLVADLIQILATDSIPEDRSARLSRISAQLETLKNRE